MNGQALPDLLRTSRLLLRAPREADAARLFASYTQDAEVARYMVWRPHESEAQTRRFVADCIQAWRLGTGRAYVLTRAADEAEPLGMLEARPMAHCLDIGYVLARAHWGQGLMPEAISALAQAALVEGGFQRMQASCDVDNHASARTLEKSGFMREGRMCCHTLHPNISPKPRPCYLYARCT